MSSATGRTLPLDAGVARWRQDQLLRTGFDPKAAAALALDRRYDLHALIELVERGCPPPVAVRIVAPLDPLEPLEPLESSDEPLEET